jgi:uncharacterized protein (TIGR03066 family)
MDHRSSHLRTAVTGQQHRRPAAGSDGQPGPRSSGLLGRCALILLIVGLTAGAAFAVFLLVLPGRIPTELVGRWSVVEGDLRGATFEFHRDGTMIGRFRTGGKEGLIEGQAEVIDRTLHTTTRNPFTGNAETGRQTILRLTETEFVTEDSKGVRVTMRRSLNLNEGAHRERSRSQP